MVNKVCCVDEQIISCAVLIFPIYLKTQPPLDITCNKPIKLTCGKKIRPFCMLLYMRRLNASYSYKLNKLALFQCTKLYFHIYRSYIRQKAFILRFQMLVFFSLDINADSHIGGVCSPSIGHSTLLQQPLLTAPDKYEINCIQKEHKTSLLSKTKAVNHTMVEKYIKNKYANIFIILL